MAGMARSNSEPPGWCSNVINRFLDNHVRNLTDFELDNILVASVSLQQFCTCYVFGRASIAD